MSLSVRVGLIAGYVVGTLMTLLALWLTDTAQAATGPSLYKNCASLTRKYPNGVKRGSRAYALAMKYNRRLDADKDGWACEKG
jgi:micrococcal nuclease